MMLATLEWARKALDGRKARIVQLIHRAAYSGSLAIGGWISGADAETVSQMPGFVGTIDAIGFFVVSAIGFLLDLLVHRARHGGFFRDSVASKTSRGSTT